MERSVSKRGRRSTALSRASIVAEAIDMLDSNGMEALTLRALASRLSTGAGALYHHVPSREQLLQCAAHELMTQALQGQSAAGTMEEIVELMLRAFDAIESHPWLGVQLVAAPWQPAVLALLDRVGSAPALAELPDDEQWLSASILVHYALGVASQYAALASSQITADRSAFLASAMTRAKDFAPDERRFLERTRAIALEHDDRDQFRTGVNTILVGIVSSAARDRRPRS